MAQSTDRSNRNQPSRGGSVAARVQALQSRTPPVFEPRSEPPPRRTFTITSIGDGGVVFGRGRRVDASFASPASRVSRDGVQGSRRDGRPPIGGVTPLLHPSCEEKEVYFRPLSSASRLGPNYIPRQDPFDAQSSQKGFLHSEKLGKELHEPSLMDHGQRLADVVAAEIRPQSTAEASPDQSHPAAQRNLTMDDLGTMLDNAIGQHIKHPAASTTESEPPREDFSQPAEASQSRSPSCQSNLTQDARSHQQLASNTPALPGTPKPRPRSSTSPRSKPTRHTATKQENTPTPPNSPWASPSKAIRPSQSPYRPPATPTQLMFSPIKDRKGIPTQAEPVGQKGESVFSPVKQRTALFENADDMQSHLDKIPGPRMKETVHHKAAWSRYQESNERGFFRAGRQLSHHRRISLDPKSSKSLIPLALPQLVQRAKSEHRNSSMAEKIPESAANHVPRSPTERNQTSVLPCAGALVSPKSTIIEFEAAGMARESLRDSASGTEAGTVRPTNEPSTVPPLTPVSRHPSKWNLLRRRATSLHPAQEARSEAPRSARSSIVESRIKDLMAASRQDSDKQDAGKVTQSTILGGMAEKGVLDEKSLPLLQMPIAEQMDVLRHNGASSPRTPIKAPPVSKPASVTEPYWKQNDSPVKSPAATPNTALRGRSKKVKTSLSPRGIPYAIEQRFSLSPSRSRSRCGTGGMHLSIEVRSSPEKQKGLDEHQVIVRASVEPDDISDESEE